MKAKFVADMDLRHGILKGTVRREPAIDFLSANEAGLNGLDDPTVLHLAAASDRVLVSHDLQTMPTHFRTFIAGRRSPGLIIVPQWFPIGQAVERMVLVWHLSGSEEHTNRALYLPTLAEFV